MTQTDPVPTLLQLLYHESAGKVLPVASPRMMSWALAFDEWLDIYQKTNRDASIKAWRELLDLLGALPWEITPQGVRRYREWLEGRGLAQVTIANRLHKIRRFYSWYGSRSIDPQCGPGFNPAADVPIPARRFLKNARLLSFQETDALLEVLKRDESLLSRRDYAFFLGRLKLGAPLKLLSELKWGQIELRGGQAWVTWEAGKAACPLPDQVWQAILDYLQAAGRLAPQRPGGMSPQAYLFPPLSGSFGSQVNGLAEDWDESRCLGVDTWSSCLQIYGRLAGIDEQKLNLQFLRHTAVFRFSETAASLAEIQAFMVTCQMKYAGEYLRALRRIHEKQAPCPFEAKLPTTIRRRRPRTSQERLKHGLYAPHLLPAEQVAEIQAQGVTHMKEEKAGLLALMQVARDWLAKDHPDPWVIMALSDAHLLSTPKLSVLIDFEKEEQQSQGLSEGDAWGVELLQTFWRQAYDDEPPGVDIIYDCTYELLPEDWDEQEDLQHSIASDRLILRNLKRQALAANDPKTFANLLQKYGRGCMRLCELLRRARPKPGRIQTYVERLLALVLADERERLGMPRGDDTYFPPLVSKKKR